MKYSSCMHSCTDNGTMLTKQALSCISQLKICIKVVFKYCFPLMELNSLKKKSFLSKNAKCLEATKHTCFLLWIFRDIRRDFLESRSHSRITDTARIMWKEAKISFPKSFQRYEFVTWRSWPRLGDDPWLVCDERRVSLLGQFAVKVINYWGQEGHSCGKWAMSNCMHRSQCIQAAQFWFHMTLAGPYPGCIWLHKFFWIFLEMKNVALLQSPSSFHCDFSLFWPFRSWSGVALQHRTFTMYFERSKTTFWKWFWSSVFSQKKCQKSFSKTHLLQNTIFFSIKITFMWANCSANSLQAVNWISN